jgi:8-oxo-dGTP diphosphatase
MKQVVPASETIDLQRGIDHIGVSVCAIVHDGEGRILLMKRGQKARDEQGRWDICGGALEFGESTEDALKREIQEELCVKPTDIKFLTVYDAHRIHNGKQTHWVALIHTAKVDPAKVKIGEPHKIEKLGWFTSDTLPEPLHSQFHKSFEVAHNAGIIK